MNSLRWNAAKWVATENQLKIVAETVYRAGLTRFVITTKGQVYGFGDTGGVGVVTKIGPVNSDVIPATRWDCYTPNFVVKFEYSPLFGVLGELMVLPTVFSPAVKAIPVTWGQEATLAETVGAEGLQRLIRNPHVEGEPGTIKLTYGLYAKPCKPKKS